MKLRRNFLLSSHEGTKPQTVNSPIPPANKTACVLIPSDQKVPNQQYYSLMHNVYRKHIDSHASAGKLLFGKNNINSNWYTILVCNSGGFNSRTIKIYHSKLLCTYCYIVAA